MITIDKILRPGCKIEIRKIDMDDPAVLKSISDLKRKQALLEQLKYVDWNRAASTYMTI